MDSIDVQMVECTNCGFEHPSGQTHIWQFKPYCSDMCITTHKELLTEILREHKRREEKSMDKQADIEVTKCLQCGKELFEGEIFQVNGQPFCDANCAVLDIQAEKEQFAGDSNELTQASNDAFVRGYIHNPEKTIPMPGGMKDEPFSQQWARGFTPNIPRMPRGPLEREARLEMALEAILVVVDGSDINSDLRIVYTLAEKALGHN